MSFYILNKSDNYAWILKNQLAPGDTLDLSKVFEGFCKPKRSSRAEEPKFSEFQPNEFDEFMEWVREEIVVDRGTFEIVDDQTFSPDRSPQKGTLEEKRQSRRALRKAASPSGEVAVRAKDTESEEKVTHKQVGKKLPSKKDIPPKEIAWLPYNEVSRDIINSIDDIRRLRTAFRLVKNLKGQERTRKLIEDRIAELKSLGK